MELREQIESAFDATPENAPIESTPVESTPVESTPVESTPIESTPIESTPESKELVDDKNKEVSKEAGKATKEPTDKPVTDAEKDAPRHRVDRAPQSWKKAEKEAWGTLPVNVRQEIHRREDQINQVLNDSAQYKQLADQFSNIASPYMARLQSLNANPLQAFEHLLKADYALSTSPKAQRAQLMADLIQSYDIDIDLLGQTLAGSVSRETSQPQAQDIQALVQQGIQQALAPIYQSQQQQQLQEQQIVVETVQSMRYDSENYPFFDQVREDMADIIEVAARRGIDIDLPTAYKRAVSLNPETSTQLEQQSLQQQARQKNEQAQRALTASSSVTGSSSAGGNTTSAHDGSLRGALESAFGGDRI